MNENGFSYEVLLLMMEVRTLYGRLLLIYQESPHVKGIKFRRNYGKSAALHSGFQGSRGRCGYYDGC